MKVNTGTSRLWQPAEMLSLNTGPIPKVFVHISHLEQKWWEKSVQVEKYWKFLFSTRLCLFNILVSHCAPQLEEKYCWEVCHWHYSGVLQIFVSILTLFCAINHFSIWNRDPFPKSILMISKSNSITDWKAQFHCNFWLSKCLIYCTSVHNWCWVGSGVIRCCNCSLNNFTSLQLGEKLKHIQYYSAIGDYFHVWFLGQFWINSPTVMQCLQQ